MYNADIPTINSVIQIGTTIGGATLSVASGEKPDDKVSGIISRTNLKNVIKRYYDAWYATTPYLLCREGIDEMENFGENNNAQGIPGQTRTILNYSLFQCNPQSERGCISPAIMRGQLCPSPITLLVIRISTHVTLASKEHGFQAGWSIELVYGGADYWHLFNSGSYGTLVHSSSSGEDLRAGSGLMVSGSVLRPWRSGDLLGNGKR